MGADIEKPMKTAHPNPAISRRESFVDPAWKRHRARRMAHWDRVARHRDDPGRFGAFYHKNLRQQYGFLVPPGLRVLEFGCGDGDLIASLDPSVGVGIDFSWAMLKRAKRKHPGIAFVRSDVHQLPIRGPFDIIILSDLINDIWDAQTVLESVRSVAGPETRLIINFHNHLWRIPLAVAKWMGLGAMLLEQNWFSPQDVRNLLNLTGFQVIRHRLGILLPVEIPCLSQWVNRFLSRIFPFSWLALTHFMIARPRLPDVRTAIADRHPPPSVSVIVPARNEAGNIAPLLQRIPPIAPELEIIFVEGNSTDDTYGTIQRTLPQFPHLKCRLFRQQGKGKGDAVRRGFQEAGGDILIILDADMTVPPEDLPRFYHALTSGAGEFINGVRLVYPMEDRAMRFFNIAGNKFFSLAFSWLLEQPVKDTLCGTKALWAADYRRIARNRSYFGEFDPFGDFDLLFGAARLNLKITELPLRYRSRRYGETNIHRWRHGWLLLRMVVFAAKRIKFT